MGTREAASLPGLKIAAAIIMLVLAAVTTAALTSGGPSAPAPPPPPPIVSEPSIDVVEADRDFVSAEPTLEGVPPSFDAGTASKARVAEVVSEPSGGPKGALPVVRKFAKAFVSYEVGAEGDAIIEAFSDTTTSALARELAQRPPRQPEDTKVPKARVLNVVFADREEAVDKSTLEASVSLLRLRDLGELRLGLIHTKRGWRVSEVRA